MTTNFDADGVCAITATLLLWLANSRASYGPHALISHTGLLARFIFSCQICASQPADQRHLRCSSFIHVDETHLQQPPTAMSLIIEAPRPWRRS